ncbi:hypothetical protein [Mycobacterium bourgelatii]|uniref:Uncharacterized protein n=1 Tax=Mycobacterium bourgelatii TaxID=1273442 RepID=A0A7I9YP99_MYCBU|nr:hypothetical protein [Mycobacterium bourgelatii]MCV6975322.1 hypothetical protein [Mycobacterium bourgelatii]GFG90447.1 hypothetical protein MBOU_24890 [Mycobacterium bourgelatii]
MQSTPLTVVREDAPNPACVPAFGWSGSIVSVVAGRVFGEIVRDVFDGGTVTHEARMQILDHDTGVRFADVQTDDVQVWRDVAAVATFLADELAAIRHPDHKR